MRHFTLRNIFHRQQNRRLLAGFIDNLPGIQQEGTLAEHGRFQHDFQVGEVITFRQNFFQTFAQGWVVPLIVLQLLVGCLHVLGNGAHVFSGLGKLFFQLPDSHLRARAFGLSVARFLHPLARRHVLFLKQHQIMRLDRRLAFVSYLVMTKGHGWKIFGLAMTSIFIFFLGLICLIVGTLPALIWIKASFASLYEAVLMEHEKA